MRPAYCAAGRRIVADLELAGALRGYLDHLAVERGLAANTLTSYRRDLSRYLAVMHDRGVALVPDVTQHHVAEFLVQLRSGDDEQASEMDPHSDRGSRLHDLSLLPRLVADCADADKTGPRLVPAAGRRGHDRTDRSTAD